MIYPAGIYSIYLYLFVKFCIGLRAVFGMLSLAVFPSWWIEVLGSPKSRIMSKQLLVAVTWGSCSPNYTVPSRSLTKIAPEKLPKPNRKGLSSNHHFSGAMLNLDMCFWWCLILFYRWDECHDEKTPWRKYVRHVFCNHLKQISSTQIHFFTTRN